MMYTKSNNKKAPSAISNYLLYFNRRIVYKLLYSVNPDESPQFIMEKPHGPEFVVT